MAQDVNKPPDSGAIHLPTVDPGHNRVAPTALQHNDGEKGSIILRAGEDWKQRKKKTPAEEAKFMAKVRGNLDKAIKAEADNRTNAIDDLNFLSGEGQWSASSKADRGADQRPFITINRLPTFIHQVTNEQRMNRLEINISPIGDKSDPEVARFFRGVIRFLERECSADIAYDTAFSRTVTKGWSYWRTITDWNSPDSFEQTIKVLRILNDFTVYLDPGCPEPDGDGANWAFITKMMPRSEYEEEFPHADPCHLTLGGAGDNSKNWISKDEVRIAEYFEIEKEKKTLVELESGHVGFEDELSPDHKKIPVVRRRESSIPHVVWYKVNAFQILDEKPWLGNTIPIVRLVGDEEDIEGKTKYSGLIRNAKDAQRSYNYAVTSEVEMIGMQPKAPYIGAEGQFSGYEQQWRMANRRAYPYLEYRQVDLDGKPAPPPQRQAFPTQPSAWAAMRQAAAQDLMATTGIRFDATLQERTYDESGRALRELRSRGDLGSFHYVDNLARSLRRQAEIFVDLIPKVINTKTMINILREDDSEEQVMVDPLAEKAYSEQRDPKTQKIMKIYNPKIGKYGVTATVGPNYATRRIESSESMMDFVRAMPNVGPAVADLIAKNADWPGGDEFATRLAKFVAQTMPGIVGGDLKDVPPQIQAMLQQMQGQIQQLSTERMAMMQQLQDQKADRDLREKSMDEKFELGLMNIIQKAEVAQSKEIGSAIKDLANATMLLRGALERPEPNGYDKNSVEENRSSEESGGLPAQNPQQLAG